MNRLRWYIECLFDLVWPPREGEPPVSFRKKVLSCVVLILIILMFAFVSR